MADDDNLTAADLQALFGVLRQQLEKHSPDLESTRRAGLDSVMDRLGQLVSAEASPDRSLDDMVANRGRLDSLVREVSAQGRRPSLKGPGAPSGSRSERLLAALQELKMFVFSSSMHPGTPSGVRDVAIDLFPRIARLTTWISEAGADASRVEQLELDQARGVAHEVRRYARLSHATLARPIWGRCAALVDANRLFFSGPGETRQALAAAASRQRLQLDEPGRRAGADAARHRWEDLRTANLAVFDLAGGDPQVYYELGMALAAGAALLLVAPEETAIPFDVSQRVRFYPPRADMHAFLADAIDEAMYAVPERAAGSSLAETSEYARRLAAAEPENGLLRPAVQTLARAESDPARFLDSLNSFTGLLGAHDVEVVLPPWPGAYPNPASPRLFAVMPFRADQEPAYAAVARAARQAGVEPVRGDVAEGQQIIASIWDELCRATHVTIDLSGFNPNVCLEMGIAHALGRQTLLIGAGGTERQLARRLPSVAKWRCHTYEGTRPSPQFEAALARFFAAR